MNVYYDPEKFGLTVIGEIDVGASYEFDMVAFWKGADGCVYAASDSGCSCPSPFQSTGMDDLERIPDLNAARRFIHSALGRKPGWDEQEALLENIKEALA